MLLSWEVEDASMLAEDEDASVGSPSMTDQLLLPP